MLTFPLRVAAIGALVFSIVLFGAVLANCSSSKTESTTNSTQSPAAPASSANVGKNTTKLPTYPSLTSGAMYPIAIPGQSDTTKMQCSWYQELTEDQSADVAAWYRNALPGAKESTITVDVIDGKNIPATDFLVDGTDHVTVRDWSSADAKTKVDLWSNPAGAGCTVPAS